MGFTVMHRRWRDGGRRSGATSPLIADPRDDEHPDVAMTDDRTGWSLSAFQTGRPARENVEDDSIAPRHLAEVSRAETTRLTLLVAAGDLDELERSPWRPGY
ncbi:hypothetical protein Asp14428_38880 [Actinoplanes sp. NBRC 14428]|nr:hypothetical protein Asp14428_38880 [Actinoplanes sp. NBRC 14428]